MPNNDELLKVPLHRSLNRPDLWLGCDREMIMFTGLMCGVLIFIGMSKFSIVLAIAIWCFCLFALRMMAKADPQMRGVFTRYIRYAKYYPAKSTPFMKPRRFAELRMWRPNRAHDSKV